MKHFKKWVLWGQLALMGILAQQGFAQCVDPNTVINFSNAGSNTAAGYTTVYVLTDNANNILASVNSGFAAPASAGTYKVYPINYGTASGATPPVLTPGTNISAIGGTCVAVGTAPIILCVNDICVSPGTAIAFSTSGQNTTAGFETRYVLTDNAGAIISSATASPIAAPAASGAYKIYTVNYNTASGNTLPTLTAPTNISAIGGTCVSTGAPILFSVCAAQCVTARVYLQGPLANNGGAVGTTSTRPLMRDNIRLSTFDGNNYIPTQDPYQFQTTYVNVLAAFNKVAPHTLSQFAQVAGPQVFTVTGENAIVDWVFVELRNKTNSSSVVATRSALVQRDGDVVDVDGVSCLSFPGVPVDNYYVAIRHRNHLGAMTAVAQTPAQLSGLVDMTDINTPIFDFGTSLPNGLDYTGKAMALVNGYRALWRDNTNADNKVKYSALANDQIKVQADVIAFPGNATQNLSYDAAFGYFNGDVDMNSKVKYTGVANDRLFIQSDVIAYPLNTSGNVSFDAYLQQLP